MSEPPPRAVLILDPIWETIFTLSQLGDILAELQPLGGEDEYHLPDLGSDEQRAIDRIIASLIEADGHPGVDLYDPTGQFECATLTACFPLEEDVRTLEMVVDALSEAAQGGHPNFVRETIEDIAEMLGSAYTDRLRKDVAVLIIEPDDNQRRLVEIVASHSGAMVMDSSQDRAYRRFAERLVSLLGNDPLDRYLYGLTRG